MKKILYLLILSSPITLTGQEDLVKTYQQVLKNFNDQKEIAYEVDYLYYETLAATNPSHQLKRKNWQTDGAFYSSFDNYEVLHETGQSILVDHTSKSIQLQQGSLPPTPPIDLETFQNLIELLAMKGTTYTPKNGGKGIRFVAAAPSKMMLELEYNEKEGTINRILAAFDFSTLEDVQYELDQKKLEVRFSNYQLETIKLPKSIHQIVQIAGNKAIGVGRYQQYSVMR